jgi:hypothetical protein
MKPLHQLNDADLGQALQRAAHELPSAPLAWQQAALALFQAGAAAPLRDTAAALGRLVRAVLSFDSWAAPAVAAGMRSVRSPTRHLLYSAEGRDIDLRISLMAERFSLSGQVLGPDETGRIELTPLQEDGRTPHEGRLDALGEFRIDDVPAGLYRLTLHVGDTPIVVQPLEVGEPPV